MYCRSVARSPVPEAIRAAGLETPMITTGIVDVTTPHAEALVRTAAKLGIQRYRWGGFRYDTAKPIDAQIAEFRAKSQELALNRHTKRASITPTPVPASSAPRSGICGRSCRIWITTPSA
jgi:hypothetical protein